MEIEDMIHSPHVLQGQHHKELQDRDPVDDRVTQHPIPCVKDSILVYQILWSNSKGTNKPCQSKVTVEREREGKNQAPPNTV